MTAIPSTRFDRTLQGLPYAYPGPGGAVAVLKDGAVLEQHCWGWADTEGRIPFTPRTLFRICSITKQFTCATVLDQCGDPSALDEAVRQRLPLLGPDAPRALHLCHNQSGLRDYWALAMLCGAPPERRFGPDDAGRLIARARSLHFTPGTRYSYANQNFRLLSDLIEAHAGRDFPDLLRDRILGPAGMATATLHPETETMPDGTIGYEGSIEEGFRAAVNRIHWTGDAGLIASLEDMIAWERFIDATRDDPDGLYRRLAAPQSFAGGAPAAYGFGLSHQTIHGRKGTGHGGGLRGWRSFRFHAPSERVSVVVLFNHMADPHAAAVDLLASLWNDPAVQRRGPVPAGWDGTFVEPETGLVARLETLHTERRVRLHYGQSAELLDADADGTRLRGATILRRTTDGIWMDRAGDNQSTHLTRCEGAAARDIEGVFHSDELDADFTCLAAGGVLCGALSGVLGPGAMEALIPVGPDVWRLPCPRALDYTPPGDWTLAFRRGADGQVAGVEIGSWLARRVAFRRL